MSVRSSLFILLLKSSVSVLIFCLVIPSIIQSEVLKSPAITVECLFLPSVPLIFVSDIMGPVVKWIYIYDHNIFLIDLPFYQYIILCLF